MLLPPPGSAPGGFCFPGFAPCEKNGCNLKRLWYNSTAHRRCVLHYASVAQWIEHQIPVLGVGGSSPFGRARRKPCNDDVTGLFFARLPGAAHQILGYTGVVGTQYNGFMAETKPNNKRPSPLGPDTTDNTQEEQGMEKTGIFAVANPAKNSRPEGRWDRD